MSEPLTIRLSSPMPEKLVTDREIFRLATLLADSLQHEELLFRERIQEWGGKDLYPGGRAVQLQMASDKFSLEASFILVSKGKSRGYRVTYLVLEARK